jgi:hypothetical protein
MSRRVSPINHNQKCRMNRGSQSMGPASSVRRIDPVSGEVMETLPAQSAPRPPLLQRWDKAIAALKAAGPGGITALDLGSAAVEGEPRRATEHSRKLIGLDLGAELLKLHMVTTKDNRFVFRWRRRLARKARPREDSLVERAFRSANPRPSG